MHLEAFLVTLIVVSNNAKHAPYPGRSSDPTGAVQVASKQSGRKMPVYNAGASVTRDTSGQHPFGWRDAMDIPVKWRQLAEPNDQAGSH